jgi:hypothetical protein
MLDRPVVTPERLQQGGSGGGRREAAAAGGDLLADRAGLESDGAEQVPMPAQERVGPPS